MLNVSAISFLLNISVFYRDKIGKRGIGIGDSFVSNNFFHNIPRFFYITFVWINKIWINSFSLVSFSKIRKVFCIVYNSVSFQGSYSSKNVCCFFDDFTKLLVIQLTLEMLYFKGPKKFLKISLSTCFQSTIERSFKVGYRFIIYFLFCYVHSAERCISPLSFETCNPPPPLLTPITGKYQILWWCTGIRETENNIESWIVP